MGSNTDADTEGTLQFDGARGDDGRLIASGWRGFACDTCSGYHLELFDDNDRVFAVMLIENVDLVSMANNLLALAAQLAMEDGYDGKLN